MSKKSILLLYGGKSVEHEISVRSAQNVLDALDRRTFNVLIVGITKTGDWYLVDEVTKNITEGTPVGLNLSTSNPSIFTKNDTFPLEIIFPVLHGTDGEDGSIQGMFKSLGLPVVGTSVLGSAISMDKIISKKILEKSKIPTSKFTSFDNSEKANLTFDMVAEQFGVPFMVKSSNQGSSVGISKVKSEDQFLPAIAEAFKYSDQLLVEQFIDGMEVECAIMGNGNPKSTWPGQIHLKKAYDFYTYEAKYQDSDAIDMVVPAPLSEEIQMKIRELSEQAYLALRCNDYARVDVFVTKTGEVFINEVNTIPGFTNASMFPVMWANMGVNNKELITHLINFAVERHHSGKKLVTDYDKA